MDTALSVLPWIWAIGHLAQIGLAIWAGIAESHPWTKREEQLLAWSIYASLPSMLGGLSFIAVLSFAGPGLFGLVFVLMFLLMPIGGAIALITAVTPPWRGHAWQAFASRLCAVAPPWAALYVTFQIAMSV